MKNYQKTVQNSYGQNIGLPVEEISFKPIEYSTLEHQYVALELLSEDILPASLEQIWQAVRSEPSLSCWTYLPYEEFSNSKELEIFLNQNAQTANTKFYLINVNQKLVGWIALLNIRTDSRVVEIGNVYFSHMMKQSRSATATLYLLLNFCFENGFRRVEWKCNELNLPSEKAALRFGFQFEGLFRQDRVLKGHNRNTKWFSILDEEWLQIRKAYLGWLGDDNFDSSGHQKNNLNYFMDQYLRID